MIPHINNGLRVLRLGVARTSKTIIPTKRAKQPRDSVDAVPACAAAGFAGSARQNFGCSAVKRAIGCIFDSIALGAFQKELSGL